MTLPKSTEKIRVLRILNRNSLGGPVLNAIFLKKFMSDRFETKLICGKMSEAESDANHLFEQYGIEFTSITGMERSINPISDWQVYYKLKEIIRQYQPHVVHTHAAKAGALGRLAASACNVPVILHTFHGHVFHSYFNPFVTNCFIQAERFLAKKSSRIIAISGSQKEELGVKYKICAPEKIVTVPNGIDLSKFSSPPANYRKEWREKYGIQEDEIAVGIIGRLTAVKNHTFFVDVSANILSQHTDKKVRFFIIGDGDGKEQITTYIASKQLSYNYYPEDQVSSDKNITLTSWEKNTPQAYAGLDIITLTSLNEGTPIALIESYAAGKPAVATNVGGVKDVILANESGFLAELNDLTAFTDALLELINNPNKRIEMGNTGQAYIMKQYSYHRLVKDMEQLYIQLLSNH